MKNLFCRYVKAQTITKIKAYIPKKCEEKQSTKRPAKQDTHKETITRECKNNTAKKGDRVNNLLQEKSRKKKRSKKPKTAATNT